MRYAPTSEQEVVVLFTLLLSHLPMRFEIDEVREEFPDCLAWRIEDDGTKTKVRIEFELYASNFRIHGHDPTGCDLIICWEDDLAGFNVPRLALRPIAEVTNPPIISLPIKPKYETKIWNRDSFLAECPLEIRSTQTDLLNWAVGLGESRHGQRGEKSILDVCLAAP